MVLLARFVGPLDPTPAPWLLTFPRGDQGSPTRDRSESAAVAGSYQEFLKCPFTRRTWNTASAGGTGVLPGERAAPDAAPGKEGERARRPAGDGQLAVALDENSAPRGFHLWGRRSRTEQVRGHTAKGPGPPRPHPGAVA